MRIAPAAPLAAIESRYSMPPPKRCVPGSSRTPPRRTRTGNLITFFRPALCFDDPGLLLTCDPY
jgi:hypothetical protein